jgi:hypothetical protein
MSYRVIFLKVLSFIFLLYCHSSIKAQEIISSYHSINKTKATKHKGTFTSKSISLPFFEDFSQNKSYPNITTVPNNTNWIDSAVTINTTLAANPPTFGFASFDGIAANGKVYNINTSAVGGADTLTSQTIDLSAFNTNDSIYISFYYEAQGFGNFPNLGDSFILQFCDTFLNPTNGTIACNWVNAWAIDGYNILITNPTWKQVLIPIKDNIYFNNLFAFRFINIATLAGINDHWHLDYIKIDKNRNYKDSLINDVAFIEPSTRLLKNYFSMPWNQYNLNKLTETNNNLSIKIKNNWFIPKNVSYNLHVTDGISGANIAKFTSPSIIIQGQSNAGPSPVFAAAFSDSIGTLNSGNCNTKIVRSTFSLNPGGAEFLGNDTLKYNTYFSNYFAYDDGSAEKAYGIQGDLSKLALAFKINVADTIKAIQIHFAHFNADVSTKLFNLMIWNNIDLNNSGALDQIKYQQLYLKPVYVDQFYDSINGWATYLLDTPQFVNAGTYYIGWQQLQPDLLNIGFDVNNDAHTNLYYNTGTASGWNQSTYQGAIMLRPVMQGTCTPTSTATHAVIKNTNVITLSPNPTNGIISFSTENFKNAHYQIIDIYGNIVLKGAILNSTTEINLLNLKTGVYFIKYFTDLYTPTIKKIIKQ